MRWFPDNLHSIPFAKAKVEAGVLLVERWILAALRKRRFFSLAELNAAIAELLERLNHRPFRKLEGSRASRFEALDRPALRALPAEAWVFAEWKTARVHVDYHIEIDRHYYSVPYTLLHRQVDARFTAMTVEIFHRGERVATHARSYKAGYHTTLNTHRPKISPAISGMDAGTTDPLGVRHRAVHRMFTGEDPPVPPSP